MALTPEQEKVKQDTTAKLTQGLEDEVTSLLKKKYALIAVAFPDKKLATKLSDDDFREMAKNAIDNREISFKTQDGSQTTITLDQINEKLTANPAGKKFLEDSHTDNIKKLVFTREQITTVAREGGEAAAENTGNFPGGTTWSNGLSGLWSGVTGGSSREPAANNVRKSAVDRLKALAASRPDIKLIIGDGSSKADGINKIGDAMYEAVMDPNTKKDKVANTQVESIDGAVRSAIKDKIYTDVYAATEAGITDRIEEEKNKIRKGDGTFLGAIMSFIFAIAKFLNMDKMLANFMGKPIPEETEIRAASAQVAQSVSETLTSPDFTYKNKSVNEMNPAELEQAIKARVHYDLQQRRGEMPSLNAEQLEEIATRSAAGVKENFDNIPKLPNAAQQVASTIDRGTLTNSVAYQPSAAQIPGDQGTQLANRGLSTPPSHGIT